MTDTLGIDLGTSSIKAARFDAGGEMIACASRAYHEPDEHEVAFSVIFNALAEAIGELMDQTLARPEPIGIGLSSQTNSFALVDTAGCAVSPVYLWTGDFAGAEAGELTETFGPGAIAASTGMTALTGQLLAPKCLHLQRHQPDVWASRHGVWLLPDVVTFALCGRPMTDPGLWSLTGVYDLNQRRWWGPMLRRLGIKAAELPVLGWAAMPAGRLLDEPASRLGLPAGLTVAVGTLDHLAGAIGVGNVREGMVSVSTGTATCVVATRTERPEPMPGGVIGRHPADRDLWYALSWSGLSSTGLNWFARQAGGMDRLDDLLAAAGEIPAGAEGWTAMPKDPNNGDAGFEFVRQREPQSSSRSSADDSGEEPAADCDSDLSRDREGAVDPQEAAPLPDGRGSDGERGPRSAPTQAQAMRAILERLTGETADLVTRAAGSVQAEKLIAIGGGARSDVWMQMLADRVGVPVERPTCTEAGARGGSRFAALATGQIGSLAEGEAAQDRVFTPAR